MKIERFDHEDELFFSVIKKINFILSSSSKDKFSVALSGGETAKLLYKRLRLDSVFFNLCFKRIHFFFVDERIVSLDSELSNYRYANELLFSQIDLPSQNIHRVLFEQGVIRATHLYDQELKSFFSLSKNEYPIFDLIVLGIGSDGHTASLFPRDIEKVLISRDLVMPIESPLIDPKVERVSLSLQTLNKARNIIFLVPGEQKRDIISKVLKDLKEDYKSNYPAALIKPEGDLFYYINK